MLVFELESASQTAEGLKIQLQQPSLPPPFLTQPDVGGACWFACLTSSQVMLIQSHCLWVDENATHQTFDQLCLLATELAMGERHWPDNSRGKRREFSFFSFPSQAPVWCIKEDIMGQNSGWRDPVLWPIDKYPSPTPEVLSLEYGYFYLGIHSPFQACPALRGFPGLNLSLMGNPTSPLVWQNLHQEEHIVNQIYKLNKGKYYQTMSIFLIPCPSPPT